MQGVASCWQSMAAGFPAGSTSSDRCQALCDAVLREYLVRRGLRRTLDTLDQELPRTEPRVKTRRELVSLLHIQPELRANKKRVKPFATVLEIVCERLANMDSEYKFSGFGVDDGDSSSTNDGLAVRPAPESPPARRVISHKAVPEAPSELAGSGRVPVNMSRATTSRPGSSSSGAISPRQTPGLQFSTGPVRRQKFSSGGRPGEADGLVMEDLEAESFSDDDGSDGGRADGSDRTQRLLHDPRGPNIRAALQAGAMLDPATAQQVHRVMFGECSTSVIDAYASQGGWGQGLFFSEHIAYGLVQLQGGPCGVLAVVQAFLLRSLMRTCGSSWRHPLPLQADDALIQGICDILEQCTADLPAPRPLVWAAPNPGLAAAVPTSLRRLATSLQLQHCSDRSALQSAVRASLPAMRRPDSAAVMALVYSVILTRGPACIQQDMDDPAGKLMAQHGYCSQELVNLFLVGQARSNVFDGDLVMNEHEPDAVGGTLHGISRRGSVGYLTLFEHYNHVRVGQHLKRPRTPIFVVCSESHYSVLCLDGGTAAAQLPSEQCVQAGSIDMVYYDELANQDEEIRLTVDLSQPDAVAKHLDDPSDLTPPLEHIIRTIWPHARVDWNGSDPLL